MAKTRIKVGGENFDEREWLRREVLWSSLVIPYGSLMKSWHDGIEVQYHNSNVSRVNLFSDSMGAEEQSSAFFNQGKKIATIVASAVLFRLNPSEEDLQSAFSSVDYPNEQILGWQARNVDIALGNIAVRSIDSKNDKEAYKEAERLSKRAYELKYDFARKRLLLRAAKIMTGLAEEEIAAWREVAAQNEEASKPILTIHNGGTPRSAGPRVEKLQSVFHEIVSSETYQSL